MCNTNPQQLSLAAAGGGCWPCCACWSQGFRKLQRSCSTHTITPTPKTRGREPGRHCRCWLHALTRRGILWCKIAGPDLHDELAIDLSGIHISLGSQDLDLQWWDSGGGLRKLARWGVRQCAAGLTDAEAASAC
jgi:hypothetical protein